MKKFGKVLALCLVAVLSLTLMLGGCTSKPAVEPAQTEAPKEAPASTEEAKKDADWPKKPVQLIVPAGAGGDTDFNARAYAKFLEGELGQPVVVVNVNGAGGAVGTKQVLDSAADGYTVLFYHSSMIINEITEMTDYGFDDYEMAGVAVVDQGNMFLVNKDAKFKTLSELVAYAKENPGKVIYGTEMGGFTYFQGLMLQGISGIEMNMVDVGGGAAKVAALKGGQIDVMPNIYGVARDFIKSGDFIPLAVFADERQKNYPDIPTAKEQGIDFVIGKPYFVMLPKGTPQEITDKMAKALENVSKKPEYAELIKNAYGTAPSYMPPAEATTFLTEYRAQLAKFKDQVVK